MRNPCSWEQVFFLYQSRKDVFNIALPLQRATLKDQLETLRVCYSTSCLETNYHWGKHIVLNLSWLPHCLDCEQFWLHTSFLTLYSLCLRIAYHHFQQVWFSNSYFAHQAILIQGPTMYIKCYLVWYRIFAWKPVLKWVKGTHFEMSHDSARLL